jgi:DNA-binding CsgD family transcriptional regulator
MATAFRTVTVLMLLALTVLDSGQGARADVPLKNVLILYSNDRLLPANVVADARFHDAFERAGTSFRVQYFSEFLDTEHFPGIDREEQVAAFLHDKYARYPLDVLLAGGQEDVFQAVHAGARAYLVKDAPSEALLETIRLVHAGGKHIPPAVGARLMERMSAPELSEREMEVLCLLATGQSNQEITAALFLSESTIKFHVNHILEKLDVTDRTKAVIVALKRGLITLE